MASHGGPAGGGVEVKPCPRCAELTEHAPDVCDTCLPLVVAEERSAQGLPPTIEDPAALERIGRIIDGGPRMERAS